MNAGTVELGLANHYYLFEKAAEVGAENLAVRNAAFQSGDPGNLVNVAGAAVLTSGADNAASEQFVDFLLSDEAQEWLAEETSEYPLVEGSPPAKICRPLSQIDGPRSDPRPACRPARNPGPTDPGRAALSPGA